MLISQFITIGLLVALLMLELSDQATIGAKLLRFEKVIADLKLAEAELKQATEDFADMVERHKL